jgi:uncharacterized phage protein gp47/JayE
VATNDLLDFLPLFPDDDEEAIWARMRAWANEGLDPVADAEQWVDTREGSHWQVNLAPAVRELARLYDLAGTEVPAAGFPVWAWGDYLDDHAEVQDIFRLEATPAAGWALFTGAEGEVIAAGTVVGVEPTDPDEEAPEFEVTVGRTIDAGGVILLPIRARVAGEAGNVGATAITVPSTPSPGVTVTNAEATTGGTEPESDEALRERVLGAYTGQGAGNRRDYQRWAGAWAGVGRVTVIPLWNGPGTVKVIVTTASGDPLTPEAVAAIQADLDPNPGMADGQAPVGAHVTVTTAIARAIDIGATIEFESGFSLDGFGGTVALRADLLARLGEYVERVESGGEVVVSQLAGLIATTPGVHDAAVTSLEGITPPVNLAISADPAEAPQLGDVVLAEGEL